MLQIKMLI